MNEADLRALLPPERPLPARRRRRMKEALMAQMQHDLDTSGVASTPPAGGPAAGTGAEPSLVGPHRAPAAERPHRRRVGWGLRRAGVAAAAAVVITVAVVADGSGSGRPEASSDRAVGGTGPAAPISAETALARSTQALDSGRAEYDVHYEVAGRPMGAVVRYEISGEDRSVTVEWDQEGQVTSEESRLVDGEVYALTTLDGDQAPRWYHFDADDPATWVVPELAHDPRSLLDELEGAGPFEEVGAATVEGVPVRRLRATHPEATPALGYGVRTEDGGVSALELLVDGAGMVRRVDAGFGGRGLSGSVSIGFRDVGEPVTVEAPADAVEAPASPPVPPGGLG